MKVKTRTLCKKRKGCGTRSIVERLVWATRRVGRTWLKTKDRASDRRFLRERMGVQEREERLQQVRKDAKTPLQRPASLEIARHLESYLLADSSINARRLVATYSQCPGWRENLRSV